VITVFYDGKCGLCRREIEYYKRIAAQNIFIWQDITILPDPFIKRGYAVQDGLKILHVEDDAGIMHQGVDAFVVIWRNLSSMWKFIALLMRIPLVLPITNKLYRLFAAWRFKKLGYDKCDL
jgi:predicted DCC family thiol-disulfide oxidoreductase YuxK